MAIMRTVVGVEQREIRCGRSKTGDIEIVTCIASNRMTIIVLTPSQIGGPEKSSRGTEFTDESIPIPCQRAGIDTQFGKIIGFRSPDDYKISGRIRNDISATIIIAPS